MKKFYVIRFGEYIVSYGYESRATAEHYLQGRPGEIHEIEIATDKDLGYPTQRKENENLVR